jgi:hypothetical protein
MSPTLLQLVFFMLKLVLLSLEEITKIFFHEGWVAFVHCLLNESLKIMRFNKKYLPCANHRPKK